MKRRSTICIQPTSWVKGRLVVFAGKHWKKTAFQRKMNGRFFPNHKSHKFLQFFRNGKVSMISCPIHNSPHKTLATLKVPSEAASNIWRRVTTLRCPVFLRWMEMLEIETMSGGRCNRMVGRSRKHSILDLCL